MSNPAMENIPIREARKHELNRWGIWLLLPLLVGIVVLFMLSMEWKSSLKIRKVTVEGQQILTEKEIITLAGVGPQSLMTAVNLHDVRKRILRQPFVKSVIVSREYSNKGLHIEIEERKPVASISGQAMRYVDKDGMVLPFLSSARHFDLPMISGISELEKAPTGKFFRGDELKEAMTVIEIAQTLDTMVYQFLSEVNMNNGRDITLYSADAGIPVMIGRDNVPQKLLSLQTFWTKFVQSESAGEINYIDLRYEDQVIVKWDKQQSKTQNAAL